MAPPTVFLSVDIDHDETDRLRFIQQLETCPVPFTVKDWSRPPQQPQRDWERLVRDRVGSSSLMIVLVGRETEASAGVQREIQFARSTNVPFFGVYVGEDDSTAKLPAGIASNRVLAWDWKLIGSAIEQLLTEGKHHVFL